MGSSCVYLERNRKCSIACIIHLSPSPAHKCFPHLILHSSTGYIYCLKCVELQQNKDLNKPQVWKIPTGNFKLNTTKHKKALVRGGRSSLIKSLLQPRHVGPNSPLPQLTHMERGQWHCCKTGVVALGLWSSHYACLTPRSWNVQLNRFMLLLSSEVKDCSYSWYGITKLRWGEF